MEVEVLGLCFGETAPKPAGGDILGQRRGGVYDWAKIEGFDGLAESPEVQVMIRRVDDADFNGVRWTASKEVILLSIPP